MDRIVEFLHSPFGIFSALIGAQWVALASLSLYCFSRNRKPAFIAAGFLFAIFGIAHVCSAFHPIASVGIFPPGSWTTRFLRVDLPVWFRRLIEPSFFLLLALLMWLNLSFEERAKRGIVSALLLLFIVWGFESLFSIPEINAQLDGAWLPVLLHGLLTEAFLLALLLGFWLGPLKGSEVIVVSETQRAKPLKLCASAALSVTLLFATILLWRQFAETRVPRYRAVHYYSWFPENWVAGFSGEHFQTPVLPELGKYNSGENEVFTRHLDWLDEAGVNVILFDWWPRNPAVRKRRDQEISYLKGRDISFALHYESLALKEVKGEHVEGEGPNDVFLTPARSAALERDFLQIAEDYMREPKYLRINDRPVLFLYASRHLVGPVSETIENARRAVRLKTGMDLYLVGDEIYFQVIDYSKNAGAYLLPEGKPNWSRLTAFDAIACYNPYDASRTKHGGTAGAEAFIEDIRSMYAQYRRIASLAGLDFFPGIIPAYNDRGVRPKENHFVVPRTYTSGTITKNFFAEALQRFVKPFLSGGRVELFTITSWNEWNEGTQIEPSAETAPGTAEVPDEAFYSAGEAHPGYGTEYLELLRRFR